MRTLERHGAFPQESKRFGKNRTYGRADGKMQSQRTRITVAFPYELSCCLPQAPFNNSET